MQVNSFGFSKFLITIIFLFFSSQAIATCDDAQSGGACTTSSGTEGELICNSDGKMYCFSEQGDSSRPVHSSDHSSDTQPPGRTLEPACILKVNYSDSIGNETITGNETISIEIAGTIKKEIEHMRSVSNRGTHDVRIIYTHGLLYNQTTRKKILPWGDPTIARGETIEATTLASGYLKEIECLTSVMDHNPIEIGGECTNTFTGRGVECEFGLVCAYFEPWSRCSFDIFGQCIFFENISEKSECIKREDALFISKRVFVEGPNNLGGWINRFRWIPK